MHEEIETVVVGAGPCGIFQVFELGLLGIKCKVIDSLPRAGGQCSTLYADKPIYDIPGFPVIGAQQLIDELVKQSSPFDPEYILGEQVTGVQKREDGSFDVTTSTGREIRAGSIVIAGGLGAFDARPLRTPGVAAYAGVNLNYSVQNKERYRDKSIAILGGGDSALDWTLELHKIAKKITLVHRREEFRAQPVSVHRMKTIASQQPDSMAYHIGRIGKIIERENKLVGLHVLSFDKEVAPVDVMFDELLVFYGLSPNLGPIAKWGLRIERRNISVSTVDSQTNVPGIFAIGDLATYPGKKKLILSGFHEAAMAAFGVQKYLYPEIKQRLQFTTTSPLMHERLGVSGKM